MGQSSGLKVKKLEAKKEDEDLQRRTVQSTAEDAVGDNTLHMEAGH